MGAQARQNRPGNEMLQLHGKITHQEKLRDARGTNKPTKTKSTHNKQNQQTDNTTKPTKTKSTHKQAKPTDRQQTGSNHPTNFKHLYSKDHDTGELGLIRTTICQCVRLVSRTSENSKVKFPCLT